MQQWSPSTWGKTFTRTGDWQLTLDDDAIELRAEGRRYKARIKGVSPIVVHEGIFWTDLTLKVKARDGLRVDGIPNAHGRAIRAAIGAVVDAQKALEDQLLEAKRRADRRDKFTEALAPLLVWQRATVLDIQRHCDDRLWITSETHQAYVEGKPRPPISPSDMTKMVGEADIQVHLGISLRQAQAAIEFWQSDLESTARTHNEEHTQAELIACTDLFDTIEKMPLTEEQARAVICFDNRVQVVAAAGSGKTSTMVAKAAYAIHRGIVAPDKICMLAFNDSAAKELQARIHDGLERIGRNDVSVAAMTFHKFGLDIIGKATGAKPRLAKWIDQEKDTDKLSELIDELKDRSIRFRAQWDLFRIVFSRDLPRFGAKTDHEDFDKATRKTGFRTLKGDVVKSEQERTLSDWLFYNGVDYEYERPYEFTTVTADHSQYSPDFYYPAMKLYHEHQALDRDGQPPEHFVGYLDKVNWAREQHLHFKTDCIETTSAQILDGDAFEHLESEFKKRGASLDPNPDRPVPGRPVIEHKDLVRLFRSFITHAKSNCLSNADLRKRLSDSDNDVFRFRHRFFLNLLEPIREAWEDALKADQAIDFEDMLNLAGEHLEAGRWTSPFELIMVDEFQDASWARARMSQALVRYPGRFLFAVGDDWQSINRFAGADISVMTGFQDWCGHSQVLKLQRTFRCPQPLCDASSAFVMKNEKQIAKSVRSETPEIGPALEAFQVPDLDRLQGAIDIHLSTLYERLDSRGHPPGKNGRVSVYVLGRYRQDAQYVPPDWQLCYGDKMTVEFRTIHKSKGSEADYIILPALVRNGFPSFKQDDPVLTLAMPAEDPHPKAEERRLFYVALTRARRSVAMFTVEGRVSPFLLELMNDERVVLLEADGAPTNTVVCPKCKKGVMVRKTGKYGPFLSCTNFPPCNCSMNIPKRQIERSLD